MKRVKVGRKLLDTKVSRLKEISRKRAITTAAAAPRGIFFSSLSTRGLSRRFSSRDRKTMKASCWVYQKADSRRADTSPRMMEVR